MFSREDMRNFVLPTDLVRLVLAFRDSIILEVDLGALVVTGPPVTLVEKRPPLPFFEHWVYAEYILLP